MNDAPDPKPVTITAHTVTVYHEVPVRSTFCRACSNADNHETIYDRTVKEHLTTANQDFLLEILDADLPGLDGIVMTGEVITFMSYGYLGAYHPRDQLCTLYLGDFKCYEPDYRGHPIRELVLDVDCSVLKVANREPVQNWCSSECEGLRAQISMTDRPARKFELTFDSYSDAKSFRVWLSDSDHYEAAAWRWQSQEGEYC